MKNLYFAHPMRTYGTPEAAKILQALREEFKEHTILDPEEIETRAPWVGCHDCMQNRMKKLFFPLVAQAEIFAIWAPLATCGIKCELHKAWELGKRTILVCYSFGEIEFEDLTLQEYHYMAW